VQSLSAPSDLASRLAKEGWLSVVTDDRVRRAMDHAYRATRSFFSLSPDEKAKARLTQGCGYTPRGVEYSRRPDLPDANESFQASARTVEEAEQLDLAEGRELHRALFHLEETLHPFAVSAVQNIARECNAVCAPSLVGSIPRWSALQVNYMRPTETAEEFINLEHEDGHFLTLAAATSEGLEVGRGDGEFTPITAGNGQFILMPGQIVSLMTGGFVRPLVHRVRNNRRTADRVALLYFIDIEPRECLPWISNHVNARVDIGQRVLDNPKRFGVVGFDVE
jgi:isopenicillin N synthase-like dioxygenase